MTLDELRQAMPFASAEHAAMFVGPLTLAMQKFSINTPKREAAFLATITHESGSLRYMREIADGSAYEGRADLGNTQPGDGVRFPGRGPGQITGRKNYELCGAALGLDLISNPELLERPVEGSASAAWLWEHKNLNGLADAERFGTICRLWNGGYNGLDDRIQHYIRARKALGL